jgi:hypothetical protein
MEVPGMNSGMVDLSGNASSQAIVYPQRERGFYNYASSGECKYCAGYGIPADGYNNHTIYFTDQDLEAERVYYSGIEYSTSMALLGPDDIYSYVTELVFLNSSMRGAEYENNLFAAGRHNERKHLPF